MSDTSHTTCLQDKSFHAQMFQEIMGKMIFATIWKFLCKGSLICGLTNITIKPYHNIWIKFTNIPILLVKVKPNCHIKLNAAPAHVISGFSFQSSSVSPHSSCSISSLFLPAILSKFSNTFSPQSTALKPLQVKTNFPFCPYMTRLSHIHFCSLLVYYLGSHDSHPEWFSRD